jgi:hypothetical protein
MTRKWGVKGGVGEKKNLVGFATNWVRVCTVVSWVGKRKLITYSDVVNLVILVDLVN